MRELLKYCEISVVTAQSNVSGHRLTYTEIQSTKVKIYDETDAIPKMPVSYGWSVFHTHTHQHSSGRATTEFCYIKKHS